MGGGGSRVNAGAGPMGSIGGSGSTPPVLGGSQSQQPMGSGQTQPDSTQQGSSAQAPQPYYRPWNPQPFLSGLMSVIQPLFGQSYGGMYAPGYNQNGLMQQQQQVSTASAPQVPQITPAQNQIVPRINYASLFPSQGSNPLIQQQGPMIQSYQDYAAAQAAQRQSALQALALRTARPAAPAVAAEPAPAAPATDMWRNAVANGMTPTMVGGAQNYFDQLIKSGLPPDQALQTVRQGYLGDNGGVYNGI